MNDGTIIKTTRYLHTFGFTGGADRLSGRTAACGAQAPKLPVTLDSIRRKRCLYDSDATSTERSTYMPLSKATFREVGVVTIVDLSGLLRLGESSAVLRAAIRELLDKQRGKIVLNFRDVTEIDSAGIGELVAAYSTVKSRDGRLKLLNPPQKVCDMLKLTQLMKVMEVYADEESAIRSFS